MKKQILVAATVTVMLSLALGTYAEAPSIAWRIDLDSATAEAKQTGKILMVDVYTDWCEWCKVLDTKTYTDAKVIVEAQQFVALKLNPEKSKAGAAYVESFGVSGYPTILFVEGDRTLVGKVVGYHDAVSFVDVMSKTTEYRERVRTDFDEFKSGDYANSRELLTMLVGLGRTFEAIEVFAELRTAVSLAPSFQETIAFSIARSLFENDQYGDALQYLKIVEDFNSNSNNTWQAHLMHSIALFYTQGKPAGIEYLDKWFGDPKLSGSWRSRYQEIINRMTESKDPTNK